MSRSVSPTDCLRRMPPRKPGPTESQERSRACYFHDVAHDARAVSRSGSARQSANIDCSAPARSVPSARTQDGGLLIKSSSVWINVTSFQMLANMREITRNRSFVVAALIARRPACLLRPRRHQQTSRSHSRLCAPEGTCPQEVPVQRRPRLIAARARSSAQPEQRRGGSFNPDYLVGLWTFEYDSPEPLSGREVKPLQTIQ